MNRKFSTLLAVFGLATSSFAMAATADIVKGDYYHLTTQAVGKTSGQALNLTLTKETKDGKAAVVAIKNDQTLATGDSALWKVDYSKDPTTGVYTYSFVNKAVPSSTLSFATGSNLVGDDSGNKINNADAKAYGLNYTNTLSGSIKFAWAAPDVVTTTETLISSYVQAKDSTMFLAVKLGADEAFGTDNAKFPLIQVMAAGSAAKTGTDAQKVVAGDAAEENPILKVKAVRATAKQLTAEELNNMLGTDRGFQLFFSYKNKLTTANNALAGVVFEAVTDATGATAATTGHEVVLKAKTLAPKKSAEGHNKYLYAYIDTVCYDAANKTNDGSKLTFKVDTIPTLNGAVTGTDILKTDAYTFSFYVDPSSPNDSVAVFVKQSYKLKTANEPRTYTVTTVTDQPFPLQLAPLAGTSTDKLVLTTGASQAVTTALPEDTRISFTGGATPAPLLDGTKVYSVKVVNEAADYPVTQKGKYMVLAPTSAIAYGEAYSSNVFDHLPSTQFVFDGAKMINREDQDVTTNALYAVEGKDDTYTNLADTFEIKVMEGVNLKDSTMGWGYISEDSLTNYAFSLDYVSGVLEGRSINMKADSSIVATTGEGMQFKLETAGLDKVDNAAEVDGVKTLYYQAYTIYTKDKKYFIATAANGKLRLVSVSSGVPAPAYYLKETENKGEYILTNVVGEGWTKFNVNSTTEVLEAVGINLNNNAFAVQVQGAPVYVLDAKGHYNIENLRGDKLAADAQGFGMFRKEGELKAAYEKTDFALYVDTAKIHPTKPSYFILSGAKAEKGTSKLEGNFLRVMSDSADVEGYKAANGLIRLAFVPAKREATSDSLLVNYQKETFVKGDSVGYKGKQAGIEQFQFKIRYTDVDGEYIVENNAGYLATYNDVLCLTNGDVKDAAQLIKLTSVEAPTANEGVEVSEVKVIAGNGNVQIIGAAGKKVVVSNILGQTVANTVISSDNATIAAPAGVVVVAIEGEDAVKAIVK